MKMTLKKPYRDAILSAGALEVLPSGYFRQP